MSTNSTFSKMVDHVLPVMPPFLEMITLQAETMARGITIAVECLSESDPTRMQELAEIELQARRLRQKHLDTLHQSYSTPIDRTDLLQAINTLEAPVEAIRLTLEEMHALNITSDNYCLEMAVVLRETANALHRGYARLATHPGMAEPDAQMGLQCLPSVDAVYRKALAKLYSIEQEVQRMQSKESDAQVDAFVQIVEILKRREEYQHFRNIAINMNEASEVLHGIVVQIG